MPPQLASYEESSTLNPIKDNHYVNKETKSLDFLFDSWKDSNTREVNNERLGDLTYEKSVWFGINKAEKTIKIKQFTFNIPTKLSSIIEEIQHSEQILDLKNDWNGEGSPKISEDIYLSSINFLMNYSKFVLDKTGTIIKFPEINPGKNGNIHLSWRTENARMIINIRESDEGILAFYYGDLNNDKSPIKGNIPVNEFSDFLAYWMNKNLA